MTLLIFLIFLAEDDNPVGWGLFWLFIVVVLAVVFLIVAKGLNTMGWVGGDHTKLKALLKQFTELTKYIEWLINELDRSNRAKDEVGEEIENLRRQMENERFGNLNPITPVLVAIGSDAMLKLDLSAFRAVEDETGMSFQRIENATFDELKRRINRARSNMKPFDKIHLAVHSCSTGLELGGQIIDAVALSEIMRDVNILVIAGCDSSQIGDFLGVVKYVISFNEKVGNDDAAIFCKLFWTQIGRRRDPKVAMREALKWSPSGMSEYIQYNW